MLSGYNGPYGNILEAAMYPSFYAFNGNNDWTGMFNTNAAQWDALLPEMQKNNQALLDSAANIRARGDIDMQKAFRNIMSAGITNNAGLGANAAGAAQAIMGANADNADQYQDLLKQFAANFLDWNKSRNQSAASTADQVTVANTEAAAQILGNYLYQAEAARQQAQATMYASNNDLAAARYAADQNYALAQLNNQNTMSVQEYSDLQKTLALIAAGQYPSTTVDTPVSKTPTTTAEKIVAAAMAANAAK